MQVSVYVRSQVYLVPKKNQTVLAMPLMGEEGVILLVLVVQNVGQKIAVSGNVTQELMGGVFGSVTDPTQGIHQQRWTT